MSHFCPNAATWRTVQNYVAFDSGSFAPLCENMSRVQNWHSILHCCRRRIKSRPQVTCTENLCEVGICGCNSEQIDRRTDILADCSILQYFSGRLSLLPSVGR